MQRRPKRVVGYQIMVSFGSTKSFKHYTLQCMLDYLYNN